MAGNNDWMPWALGGAGLIAILAMTSKSRAGETADPFSPDVNEGCPRDGREFDPGIQTLQIALNGFRAGMLDEMRRRSTRFEIYNLRPVNFFEFSCGQQTGDVPVDGKYDGATENAEAVALKILNNAPIQFEQRLIESGNILALGPSYGADEDTKPFVPVEETPGQWGGVVRATVEQAREMWYTSARELIARGEI